MMDVIALYKLIIVAFSGGKDSSVTLAETFKALLQLKSMGMPVPRLLITSSNTGTENPEVERHLHEEHRKIRAYAMKHGLDVDTKIVKPSIAASFIGRILTGQMIPVFANVHKRTCTDSWKINPQERFLNSYLKEHGYNKSDVITLVGSRLDESVVRANSMKKFGMDTQEVSVNENGFNVYAPIAYMTTDDIWLYIGEVINNMHETYSDFENLMRIYKDANGECVLIKDNSAAAKKSRACGARHGCWSCCSASVGGQVTANGERKLGEDKSLTNMINTIDANGERPYAYMQNLTNIQRFLVATQWDWNRRNWLGRALKEKDGKQYIKITPDTYSGEMVLELFRYMLTAQAVELEEADKLGIEPRFTLIKPSDVIFLDARWSERGLKKPFTACKAWYEVMHDGARYFPDPELFFEKTPIPKARYIEVDKLDTHLKGMSLGHEMSCGDIDFEATASFEVNPESAEMALAFFRKDIENMGPRRYAYSMQHWIGLGAFTPASRSENNVSYRMALTNRLEEMGVLEISNNALYAMAEHIDFPIKKKKQKLSDIPVETGNAAGSYQLDLFCA